MFANDNWAHEKKTCKSVQVYLYIPMSTGNKKNNNKIIDNKKKIYLDSRNKKKTIQNVFQLILSLEIEKCVCMSMEKLKSAIIFLFSLYKT